MVCGQVMSDSIDVAATEDPALAQLDGGDVGPCAPPTEATLSEAADDCQILVWIIRTKKKTCANHMTSYSSCHQHARPSKPFV